VSGTGPIPTGLASLEGGPNNSTQGIAGFNLTNGAASGSANLLPGGTYSVIAHYPGDSNYGPSDSAPVSVTVNRETSQMQAFLVTFDFSGNLISTNTTSATYGSPYLLRVNVENSAGHLCTPISPAGATGCPTGQILLSDNGNALDAGTYTLNSYGYVEDQIVQLAGGTHSVTTAYSGDTSFSPPTAPTNVVFNIAPASTTMGAPTVSGGTVGVPFQANVTIRSSSLGAAPTGTVTFLVNGNPITGTISHSESAGTVANPTATLTAYFGSSPSIFANPGTYTISASYSGDGNYVGSTSPSLGITVKYPMPSVTISSPSTLTVPAGAGVTLTALVDTSLKNVPVPTGTVPFINWGPMIPIGGTETYSTVADSNGNVALQASFSFVPAASGGVTASYSGDSNYPAVSGGGFVNITVTGSDFAIVPGQSSVMVTRGSSAQFSIFVQGQVSYAGIITFSAASCSGLPSESSCLFRPTTVDGVGSTNLIVSATAPHSNGALARDSANKVLLLALGVPFPAVLLIGISRRTTLRVLAMGLLLGVLFIGIGCGGGSGGGGGGAGGGGPTDPGTPAGKYPITITATSVNGGTGTTHTATFNLVVQ